MNLLSHLFKRRRFKQRDSTQRRDRERGSILVEVTLVIFPLTLIAMGMVEMGVAWRDSNTLEQASRTGARVSANLSNDVASDREAVRSLVSLLNDADLAQVEYVVIYQVDSSGNMPAGCENSTSTTPLCNYYPPAALTQASLNDDTKWECANAAAYDNNWCPTSRSPEFHTPVDLGVKIKSRHNWVTDFFPGTGVDLTGHSIFRLNILTR